MDGESRRIFDKHFQGVTIERVPDPDRPGKKYIRVTPFWKDVDRPNVGGWGLEIKHMDLAKRLARAVAAGAVYGKVERLVDDNGKSYISAQSRILSRHMDADLRKLGF